jgi:hypothetical protein
MHPRPTHFPFAFMIQNIDFRHRMHFLPRFGFGSGSLLTVLGSLAVANLCDFQYRFSRPMELPFGLGDDLEEPLETPRPLDVLLRFKYAFPVEENMKTLGDIDEADRMRTEDGKEFCFSGMIYPHQT